MNTKSLNKIKEKLNAQQHFNLEFESQMVQSRIISTFLEVVEMKQLTQKDLEKLTALPQPFLSALFNNRKKLNVEHIAKLQKALNIVLMPPRYLTEQEHQNTYYNEENYLTENSIDNILSEVNYNIKFDEFTKALEHHFNSTLNIRKKSYLSKYKDIVKFKSIKNTSSIYEYA